MNQDDYDRLMKLMRQAIEEQRPDCIKPYMLPVWNQPFFYKIDKARVLTLSYNPTDGGAKNNYPYDYYQYKKNGFLPTDRILEILYTFKKESKWRKAYDNIFGYLGYREEEIAHMDVSFFPYSKLEYYKDHEYCDKTYKYLLDVIRILDEQKQLDYIFIDGARNKDILYKIIGEDGLLISKTYLPVNNSGHRYELSMYLYNKRICVIYFGCFLYGATCPSDDKVLDIAKYIKNEL